MNVRLVERDPADCAEREVGADPGDARPDTKGDDEAGDGEGEPWEADPLGVEDRNDDDRADVVDDGEGGQTKEAIAIDLSRRVGNIKEAERVMVEMVFTARGTLEH